MLKTVNCTILFSHSLAKGMIAILREKHVIDIGGIECGTRTFNKIVK